MFYPSVLLWDAKVIQSSLVFGEKASAVILHVILLVLAQKLGM